MITAILSSFNEHDNPIFWANIELLRGACELIIVDGGSQDGTFARFRGMGVCVHLAPGASRAQRYNLGMDQAHGDWIILVHSRSLMSLDTLQQLEREVPQRVWGGFTHSFDQDHPMLKFTSWYSNQVRGALASIFYLDHCLFFSRDLLSDARFPDVHIFEDTYFCRQLRRVTRGRRLPAIVVTSAVRFQKNGFARQALMNQVMKVLFFAGVSEKWMNRIYERGLSLNMKSE